MKVILEDRNQLDQAVEVLREHKNGSMLKRVGNRISTCHIEPIFLHALLNTLLAALAENLA